MLVSDAGAPPLRLLIDACLTPAAATHLTAMWGTRVDVVHVDRVLPPATSDADVLHWAMRENRLIVTANDADFVDLVRHGSEHPGLALIDDQNTRAHQIEAIERLVRALLRYVEEMGSVGGHVFVLRRGGRLSVRKIPDR